MAGEICFLFLMIGCTKHTTSPTDLLCPLFIMLYPWSTGIVINLMSSDSHRERKELSLNICNRVCCIIWDPSVGRELPFRIGLNKRRCTRLFSYWKIVPWPGFCLCKFRTLVILHLHTSSAGPWRMCSYLGVTSNPVLMCHHDSGWTGSFLKTIPIPWRLVVILPLHRGAHKLHNPSHWIFPACMSTWFLLAGFRC